ncbi:MAG: hypothetical protein DMG71_15705 [Acidobacteria bacterium]|nr:MAG: hypothetical protein DMG71_15705 [Acidobacteriota bacterium]
MKDCTQYRVPNTEKSTPGFVIRKAEYLSMAFIQYFVIDTDLAPFCADCSSDIMFDFWRRA